MDELRNLQQMASLASGRFNQYGGEDFVLPQIFKEQVTEINSNTITYNKYSAIIETRGNQHGILNIFMPNQWFYIASYFTDFYNELQKYKRYALQVTSKERLKELNGGELTATELSALHRLTLDDKSMGYLLRFITDYSWWGGAKTIDRGDFYVSPILSNANLVNASQSFVADLCAFLADKQNLVRAIINKEESGSPINARTLLFQPCIESKEGINGFLDRAIPIVLERDADLYRLDKFANVDGGVYLTIGRHNLGRASDKDARPNDINPNIEWTCGLNGKRYYLNREVNYPNFVTFQEAFNEAYKGIFEIVIDTIDYNGTQKKCYSLYAVNPAGPFIPNHPLQQIFYGAPGTGKSHTIKKVTDGIDSKFVIRTTFHPDSDYSTFVGAYKPKMEILPRYNPQTGEQMGVEKRIVYAYTPQAFLKAYTTAWKTPEQAVYLIIEEINRGNCAQIFGDLFQLLDRGDNGQSCYPIKADQDMQMHLMEAFADYPSLPENIQSGEELVLPSNLYVWATMNTSDQSLFPIDSAFKRRWEWKYIPITQGKDEGKLLQWSIEAEGVKYDWWSFLEVMNKRIGDTTSSEDKKLGFFFCKADEQGIISADKFVSKVLFYLWNDVFKDYPDNPIAMHLKEEGSEFTYGDFYTANAQGDVVVREELVTRLLDALGVTKVNAINADEAYDERTDISTSEQERKDTLSSVSINGKLFTEQEYTQFDLYMNVLREIGIDRAGASIESMKFIRKGSKMATQNPLSQLADGYTYVKEGEYYFIKGANPYTLIRILEELKKILHLDMVIAYR